MDQNIIVNESCKNLRALGKNALKGKWTLAVLATLLYGALTTVPVIILNTIFGENMSDSGVSSIYSLLITGPMMLGYAMFAISIFRNRETSPAEVFYGFERFGKALGLYIVTSIFIFLWSLLLIVPGIIAALRYSMSFYILADNPNIGIMEAIEESKKLMQGNKWKFFCLNLSFIGWGLLSILTLGIGFLWLMPYVEVSIIAFYEIANGSLRAARSAGWEPLFHEGGSAGDDPFTVYKEGQETSKPDHSASEADEKPMIEESAKKNEESLLNGEESLGNHKEE